MTEQPHHTDYVVGDTNQLAALAANYQCGHCNSDVELTDMRIEIRHDDGCPVLAGTLPSAPDVLRAVQAAVPNTFRP